MTRARLSWLAVPAAGLIELGAHYYFAGRAPKVEEWADLRPAVEQLRKEGELVVVAPQWAEPLARQAFGDALMPMRDVARPDDSGYARAIEVSMLGQHAAELRGWTRLESERHGAFELSVLENPRAEKVLYDFVDHIDPSAAEVAELEGGGAPRPCLWRDNASVTNGALGGNPTFPSHRFSCASGEWFFVGVTIIDDNREYQPRRCIWSHPSPAGPTSIRFRSVPLGRTVHGFAGLPWLLFRDGVGAPVELEVLVDGHSVGKATHRDQDGWSGFSFPTGREGGTGEVEFRVSTANAKDRHFCFAADMR
jgi:hypothetical protein